MEVAEKRYDVFFSKFYHIKIHVLDFFRRLNAASQTTLIGY